MIKKWLQFFILYNFLYSSIAYAYSATGEELAKKLHLMAGYKAMAQWERIFKSERKKKRYKIDTLTKKEQEILKQYLINHAIDSDHPTVAGEF